MLSLRSKQFAPGHADLPLFFMLTMWQQIWNEHKPVEYCQARVVVIPNTVRFVLASPSLRMSYAEYAIKHTTSLYQLQQYRHDAGKKTLRTMS